MLEAQGERATALEEFTRSVAILEKLLALDPGNALWQSDLEALRAWLRSLEG